ncbi:hypothetical protein [Frigoribacterium sp. VKM Ac-2530]|uniref:hypothetical protein n=1 Tax=Frigoribacterium sp. VKM Ac-2530 TaxID=2783822 RepID=UPI001889EAE1|nr:hypothetical protein [Frigoribacterium sp. VKM Ac-2530]MBF4578954.1 hypothetical protein [Frigoribacterium sp. VKM Ac-2530]
MAKLRATVVVRDDKFITHVFVPGQDVPKWAVDKITTPGVWAEEPKEPKAPKEPAEPKEPKAPKEPEALPAGEVPIPPKSGAGSSAKAWAAYGLSKGYEVDETAKASEIRDALAEAGVPVE